MHREPRRSFNSQRDGILRLFDLFGLPFLVSFNSQRDGILPSIFAKFAISSLVSIPNGMEFYVLGALRCYSMSFCFNSQRDGILLDLGSDIDELIAFQFPTGWNSTEIPVEDRCYITTFQFPTGWNSTKRRADVLPERGVSIPNGMEFYEMRINSHWRITLRFNSQRDGILPFCFGFFGFAILVSIPNGMEFYSALRF